MKTFGDVLNYAIEVSKGKPDVFIEYSAHVGWIVIRVYKDGWTEKSYETARFYLEDKTPEECIKFIEDAILGVLAEDIIRR